MDQDLVAQTHPHEPGKGDCIDAGNEEGDTDFLPGKDKGKKRRCRYAKFDIGDDDFECAGGQIGAETASRKIYAPFCQPETGKQE